VTAMAYQDPVNSSRPPRRAQDDADRQQPRPSRGGEIIGFFGVVCVGVGIWLLSAWAVMITVGVIHAQWIHALPTIGFRLSMLLSALWVGRSIAVGVLNSIAKDAK